ncbi:MAG: AAA family ATPase [Desulfovibrionaceae bacterium]|nr:AAA family ATPase [Desulfovibrionaceae bacterium]
MLEFLHIRNLALIEDASLDFTTGMNVLTGETGAGKSFILKALSFLLGDKLKADIVRRDAERAIVEALFQTSDGELILRRELIAATGRSRIFINDTLHSQEILKELRPKLITYTSQHAQQQLLQPAFQSKLVEKYFPDPTLLTKRDEIIDELKGVDQKIQDLLERQKNLLDKRELLEMQQAEIEKVAPEEGEEERLEEIRSQARNQEVIIKTYDAALKLLYSREPAGIFESLDDLERHLTTISELDESFADFVNGLADFRALLDALASRLQDPPELEDGQDLNRIEERLYALAQLKRKLHKTIPQICALKQEIEDNLSFLDSCALDLKNLHKEEEVLKEKLAQVIAQIIPLRHEAAENFTHKLEEQLKDLAFSDRVRVIPEYLPLPVWKEIKDERIRFLWAPNPGQTPQPLDHIASGGELSRFLLALTSLEIKEGSTTYIFDEVDAGVGGLTLGKLAEKLADLAKKHQIILITHWPQLASQAKRHFQIQKIVTEDSTSTICHALNEEERKAELARMAGGGELGAVFLKSLD